ncbi:MAG TPA: MFS transporter [Syntrophorhabdaceae bacterium]|nr:MFS transporter [Syntrophorhabdaceae bacterium]
MSLLMYAIDGTVVAVAFPNFTRELHTNVLWSAWTISIFYIAVTIAMPLAGNLADSFGRKKVFVVSLILFTGSSLACGLAPTIQTLIAFRFLQALGGACFLPSASGIVSDCFPEHREAAIGLFSSIFSIGMVIGPNLGGWIVSRYSWRYIFYINVPIGIALIVATMMLLRESRIVARTRVDLAGVALMSGTLLFLMLGLNFVAESFSPYHVAIAAMLVIASCCLAVLFLKQEKATAEPILDIALLQSKPFMAANTSNLILGMTTVSVYAFVPYYAVSVHKFSTLMSGMILTPRSFAMAGAATVTSFLLRRLGYRWPMVFGFAVVSITTIFLAPSLFPWNVAMGSWGTVETLSFLLFINGLAGGVVFPAANNACIELMPDKVGTIVALRNTFRSIGFALGTSFLTGVLHVASGPARGFTIVYVCSGLLCLASIPLLFLMPAGRAP